MNELLSLLHLEQYSAATIVWLIASAMVAGLARGFSGFGAALIFTPLASVSVGPQKAAPLLLAIDAVASVGLIPDAWRRADRREIATMALGAMVGTPIGAWLLTRGDPIAIRWAIVAVATPMLMLLVLGWRYHGTPKTPLTVAVGSLSGFLGGLAQLSGPPIILYWLGGQNKAGAVRANIILFLAIATVFSGVSYWIGGLLGGPILGLACIGIPAYALALWLGARMFDLASEPTFRNICYALAGAILISLPIFDGMRR
jgi:uncharacterized protein